MARGDSTIRVSIIGDASKLLSTFDKVNKKSDGTFGTLLKIGAGSLIAGEAVNKVFDITQDSLTKADDFNDKLDTLSKITTPAFASHLRDVAFGMSDIGLSASQVADAADAIASYGKAAGVSEPQIEAITPKLLDVAEAVHAKTGKTVAEVIDDIGKAIGGSKKTVADYGVIVDKTLNPDDRILSILDQLTAKYGDATSAASDLQGTQDKINAKVDDFEIKLGEALAGPMNGLADIGLKILDEISDWPGAIEDLLGPLASARDIFGDIAGFVGDILRFNINDILDAGGKPSTSGPGRGSGPHPERTTVQAVNNFNSRNGLGNMLGGP